MIPNEFKHYLIQQGAGRTSHSGHTLWDHLVGVHRILEACKSADYVCVAGLFHSVYGTQAFKKVTIDSSRRAEVQDLIGTNAESLVWAFCNLPRPKLFEMSLKQQTYGWLDGLAITHNKNHFFDDLVRLECANLLEQKSLYKFKFLVQKAQEIRMLDREGFSV